MKFSINNLITKYNLVLLLSILFIPWLIYKLINLKSYKEHMNDPYIKSIIDLDINYSNIPICSGLNENNCSKNNYCKWNTDKKVCNKLDVCDLLDVERCNKSKNCIWNKARTICLYK